MADIHFAITFENIEHYGDGIDLVSLKGHTS